MIDVEDVPAMFVAYQNRWAERDARMAVMAAVVAGDWSVTGEDNYEIENRSPNLIQVALEDTAEAAAMVPSVRVKPSGKSQAALDRASAMERMAVGYFDQSQIELLTISEMLNIAAYGMFSFVVSVNAETGSPYLQWRDPRTCYPEPDWSTYSAVKRCMFARDVWATQLPDEWQAKIRHKVNEGDRKTPAYWDDKTVTLLEIYTEEETLITALYKSNSGIPGAGARSYTPIELDRQPTVAGVCQAIVGQTPKLDAEPRGQFDQVVRVMQAHIRLMGTVLDYADQAVYADVWVKDLIGEMPIGGGSYIQLGPQGAIGRVAPAVPGFAVFEELNSLMDSIHVGGRWPKARPGEIDQAIASGKFLETSAGMMNTAIRTMHLVSKRGLEQAMRLLFLYDKKVGKKRTIAGVLNNQQFQIERNADDIDLEAIVNVEFGLGLGRDQAQSMVIGIQARQAGLVSGEFVQENFEGLTDVQLERQRIDTEQFRDMALARMMQGLESGEIPTSALSEIAKARRNGDDIFELFDEYIAKPQEEAMQNQITSGLTGEGVVPGAPPMTGAQPPTPPSPADLLGGGGGPELATIGRTSVPLGNGSFAGVESRG